MMSRFILVFLLVSLSMPSLSIEGGQEEAAIKNMGSAEDPKLEANVKSGPNIKAEKVQSNKINPIEVPLKSAPLKSLQSPSLRKPADISTLSNWPVVMMALLGMIFLIFALAWLVRRFSGINFSGGQNMKIMSSLALGAKERVSLVEVNGTQFLLGVTSQSINHLHTFEAELIGKKTSSEEEGRFSSNSEGGNQKLKGGFSEKLNQLLENKLNPTNADELEK